MSYKVSSYTEKPVDAQGNAAYTEEDHAVWHDLIIRQKQTIQNKACDEYIRGIALLDLSEHRIPQCHEVSAILQECTGWSLEPVPALIPFEQFFHLLAHRKFPAATFIRRREELDYLQEPDIFHEIFGHCPLLTNPAYANFTERYGQLALQASPIERKFLARLYWFTIEFGLIKQSQGLRAYGGGILSSHNETIYALESATPHRKAFDPLDALRQPYRIDVIQPLYFVIEHFDTLYQLTDMDLLGLVRQAIALGEYPGT